MRAGPFIRSLSQTLEGEWGRANWWPGGDDPPNVIVGAVLTQNTSWSNVERALANLDRAGLGRDLRKIARFRRDRLARHLRPVGHFNVKAERLQSVARWFVREWSCDWARMRSEPTDRLREALLGVHGIGKETADTILCYGLGHPVFVVDAYTKRVLLRHGLIDEGATYDQMQALFQRHLPTDLTVYRQCHAHIVRLGATRCRRVPRCGQCPLGSREWFTRRAWGNLGIEIRTQMTDTESRGRP